MPIKFDNPIQSLEDYGEQIIAPILMDYVEWILERAKHQNLKRLYFLARDGHILRQLAVMLCKENRLEIDCHYLYCSRYALRSASYGLLSEDEVLSMVGISSIKCSPKLILERCHITDEEIGEITASCNITDPYKLLDTKGRQAFMAQLRMCPLFWTYLRQESNKAYETAISYFEQEGLLNGDVALVDSGWSGSMQRSLGKLLRSAGFSGHLEGFYFGMYQPPRESVDGIYHTFYFNHAGKLSDKAWFNNNLFECMLAAPHGMTIGYEENNAYIVPVLREKRTPEELKLAEEQETGILRYIQRYLKDGQCAQSPEERVARCRKNLRRCMVHPTRVEVELLRRYQFCDDSTEEYFLPLAEVGTLRMLNTRLIPIRVLQKLTHNCLFGQYHPFVWYYGAVVGAPNWLQPLYRWNEYLWECVRLSR